MTFDAIVRGGTVHLETGPAAVDVGIADGAIAALAPELAGGAATEIDARGLQVLPGAIDAHVHLNDPGRADWEGFATGTAAMAAGGTTCFADMPLNSVPPTVDAVGLAAKLAAAEGRALADFALWGGIVPGPIGRHDDHAAAGVCGFKAFLSASGVDEFPRVDPDELGAAMERAAALGLPVAVHAEDDALTGRLARAAVAEGRTTMRDYLASRPPVAELMAIDTALALAATTGCALHLVHVSTVDGIELALDARRSGVTVTVETCPHYLLLDEEDAVRIGALAKCAPPLRPAADRDALAAAVVDGRVDLVASDHSPAPAAAKAGDDAFAIWGGISGCQTLLAGTLSAGVPVAALPRLLAAAPARLLGIDDRKGRIAPGLDADLVLVDDAVVMPLAPAALRYRHPHSPLAGRALRGRVVRRLLRGGATAGRFVPRRAG